jgi:TPP-dependent pyruvate/acetoin dehydrogenase alpha subunit
MSMSLSPNLPPDTQRAMLRQMLTIRRFEERASVDYHAATSARRQSQSASVQRSIAATGSSRRIGATATASPRAPTSTA